ncbi:hypothetical protein PAECIP111802_07028 [Paenibacillus allorhizosphaerae]|uniref:Uncharacterized protein n=1 Tax=Paenibacillus allorhizosphaerae TaxID=2849866 RepID=A0ABM8VTX1_9BACL|nr:hypothetical protein PAECIP111802_07028 [Paenibacillus allorhizosphaerae]
MNGNFLLYPYHNEIVKPSGSCLEFWHLEDLPEKRLQVFSVNYEDEAQVEAELRVYQRGLLKRKNLRSKSHANI